MATFVNGSASCRKVCHVLWIQYIKLHIMCHAELCLHSARELSALDNQK
jgi:hypothetical protein